MLLLFLLALFAIIFCSFYAFTFNKSNKQIAEDLNKLFNLNKEKDEN